MAGCLDGEDRVERLVRRIDVQEVAVQELGQMRQLGFFGELSSAFDLIGIAVYANDFGAGKAGNLQ